MYVYRFIDKNNRIIYVGKTKQTLRTRFYSHNHLPDECYQKVWYIEYIECHTEADMSMKEIYYINREHAKGNAEYNTADVSENPQDFDFRDNWTRYNGSLPVSFPNSINVIENYSDEREEIITASDGRQMKLVYNTVAGIEKYVYPFTSYELSSIFAYFKLQMQESPSILREYGYFRDMLLIAIGISTPFKIKELLDFKYSDVFDEDNEVRGYRIVRNNVLYEFAYPFPVIKLLYAFQKAYGANFENDRSKYIFVGNTGEKLTYTSINKSLLRACANSNLSVRHSGESLRKTYFRHIYDSADNICEAIECIEFLSGTYTHFPGRVLKYIEAIPHDYVSDPAVYIKDKYIINKVVFDWDIEFKYQNKWEW